MDHCLSILLTDTCLDDGLWFGRVAAATGYMVAIWTWGGGWLVPETVLEAPQCPASARRCFLPVGCIPNAWLAIYSLDSLSRPSAVPEWRSWRGGGGRYLDSSHGGAKPAPLCGGPGTEA